MENWTNFGTHTKFALKYKWNTDKDKKKTQHALPFPSHLPV